MNRREKRAMTKHIKKLVPKLRALDMEWGYEYINNHPFSFDMARPLNEKNILAGLHKCRVVLGKDHFTAEELETSCVWLEANGFEIPGEN